MKNKKLNLVGAAVIALSASTFSINASAATTVWDSANGLLITAQSAMQYAMMSLTNSGIDMVASNQAKLSMTVEASAKRQIAAEKHFRDADHIRKISADAQDMVIDAANQTAPTVGGCIQRTSTELALGIGAANGGKYVGGAALIIYKQRDNTVGSIDNWGQKLYSHDNDADLCSEVDVLRANGRKNLCAEKGVGIMADADKRAGALFSAPGTGETVVRDNTGKAKDETRERIHLTYDKKALGVAQKLIDNIVTGEKPELLPPAAENTPQGRTYVGMTRVHDARLSTATSALTEMVERRAETPSTKESDDAWAKTFSTWRAIFSPGDKPMRWAATGPSVMEAMAVRVYAPMEQSLAMDGKLWDGKSSPYRAGYDDRFKLMNAEEKQREMLNRINLNTQVNWMIFQQLEKSTAIQAAQLAHSMEPIKPEVLQATADAAKRGKK
jgi:hypothetical protein